MSDEGTPAPKKAKPKPEALPGAAITDAAREKAEADAAILPTTPEEQLRYERANELLKASAPRYEATVIKTPPGRDHVHISGDDLADAPPGGRSQPFRVGDKVMLTPAATEKLVAQGWVKL